MDKSKVDKYKKLITSGDIYDCLDQEMINYQREVVERFNKYNLTSETKEGIKEREKILKECLATYNPGITILPPIHANWGLINVHIGKDVFMNYNTTLVDDGEIFIGDNVMFGPNVTIITAAHPISPNLRKYQLQYNKKVVIKNNVWLGANVTILPGITIGENSIIGAGAIVTKNIPANVIAVGNPARILREINKDDYKYNDGKEIPKDIIKRFK